MVVQQRIVPHSVEVEINAWSQPMLDWYKGECVTMVSKNLLDRYQNCNTSHTLVFQGEKDCIPKPLFGLVASSYHIDIRVFSPRYEGF